MSNDETRKPERTKSDTARWERITRRALLGLGFGVLGGLALGELYGLQISDPYQRLTDDWSTMAIAPRQSTLVGISLRPHQAELFGLDLQEVITTLFQYPIQLVRLGAYWNSIEAKPGEFNTDELDWQLDALEKAGAQVVLCVGALKTFGYPEYFIPAHYMPHPLPDWTLITPEEYPQLSEAANAFIHRIVAHTRQRTSIVAWQLENEPLDPLSFAHYWRISRDFLEREYATLRDIDPSRPVMINGFSSSSFAVKAGQAWITRDQGDSLTVAKQIADIVGVDYYPKIALSGVGSKNVYLNSGVLPWAKWDDRQFLQWGQESGKKVMVAEGQAEPWELKTLPDVKPRFASYSCSPQDIIANYNSWLTLEGHQRLYAYLFWGAEYWVLRKNSGDTQYLEAFGRVMTDA